jgi:hypothetical protein
MSNAGTAGLYRVSYQMACTASGDPSTVTLTIAANDGAARTYSTAAMSLEGTEYSSTGSYLVKLASGNVTYATTVAGSVGAGRYGLRIVTERLN